MTPGKQLVLGRCPHLEDNPEKWPTAARVVARRIDQRGEPHRIVGVEYSAIHRVNAESRANDRP